MNLVELINLLEAKQSKSSEKDNNVHSFENDLLAMQFFLLDFLGAITEHTFTQFVNNYTEGNNKQVTTILKHLLISFLQVTVKI